MPAGRGKARGNVLAGRKIGRSIDGDAVVVPQHDQPAQLEVPGQADRLVVDAFHHAAVADDHESPVIDQAIAIQGIEMPLGHGHADGHGQALPQRPRGAFRAGEVDILRMAGARAAKLAEIADVLDRRRGIAGEMQQRIEQHRTMAGREHEAVAIGPFRSGGVELEEAREQHGRDIGHAHRHARVPAVRRLDGVHRQGADGVGHRAQSGGIERHREGSG